MKSDVRILIVDDSQAIREFVVQALTNREGFITLEASDGAQGLEMAVADPPDLMLLDMEMPRMDGFQVVDGLRARQVDIPIILITSHGSEAIAIEFFRKGVKDYMSKPFTVEEMYVAIERALTETRLRREKEDLAQRLIVANQQLQRRVQELSTLYQVGKWVASLLSKDQLLDRILDVVLYVVDAEEAAVVLMNEETGQLQTELYRQRVPGEVQQTAHRTAKELATAAVRKRDIAASGAMLYAPLKVGDRAVGALGVGNRVSARPFGKHDQRLLLALADYAAIALENARLYEEVRQADRAKSEFVSFVAHELRTPMTSIRGYAELLAKGKVGPLTPQQGQFIGTVLNNVERMHVLVSDLLDISRIETGQLHLEMKQVRLAEVLADALQTIRGQIQARSQHLTVKVPESLSLIRADPDRLTQILVNLLSNAQKYTPDGGHIHVRAWPQNAYVHCAVSDSGIGISPEDQTHLFTKFFRAEEPAVQEMPGTGLGLCIVKILVELQGGSIKVESQFGKGTTVEFTVPMAAKA
jgi:signal transduction histidine kinase